MIFERERSINSLPPAQRLAMRAKEIGPLFQDFEVWMRAANGCRDHDRVHKAYNIVSKWEECRV